MSTLTSIAVIPVILYVILLIVFITAWYQIQAPRSYSTGLKYCVVVPFRDEGENLTKLIDSLYRLDFSLGRYEVILVNDHSNDRYELGSLPENFSLLNLPDSMTGKKAAINFAIQHTDADVIVTTDADCVHHPNWLSDIDSHFAEDAVQLVFGSVVMESDGMFQSMQKIEFATLIGSGATTLELGMPTMCNGANLAYRKIAFEKVNGFEGNQHIASGDDEFLMTKIYGLYPNGVRFNKFKSGVITKPAESLNEFYQQRKRWASKWSEGGDIKKSLLAVFVFITSIASLYLLFSLPAEQTLILAVVLVVKLTLEGFFISQVLKLSRQKLVLLPFLFLQIIYPFYVIVMAISANIGSYQWKGRVHEK